MEKEYLGDSVYAEISKFGDLVLTTENGVPADPSNTIIFEPETWQALERYVKRYFKMVRKEYEADK